MFVNLEHLASPNEWLHRAFLEALDEPIELDDLSERLLDVETQLGWLRDLRFEDVDCFWKWREMAVLGGRRPKRRVLMTRSRLFSAPWVTTWKPEIS